MTVADISDTVFWVIVITIAVGTYAFRASFVVLFGYLEEVPSRLTGYLQFVPAAAIAALVAPALVAPNGSISVSLGNEQLLAGGVAAIVAYRTENMLATIAAGMAALYVIQALVA